MMSDFLNPSLSFSDILLSRFLRRSFSANHVEPDLFKMTTLIIKQGFKSFLLSFIDLHAPHQRDVELFEMTLRVDDKRVQGIDDCACQACLSRTDMHILQRLDLADPVNDFDESLVIDLSLDGR